MPPSEVADTLELVIFDCDGVLVDSEPIANRVFRTRLAELGLSLSAEQMDEAFMGRSIPDCLEIAAARLARPLPQGFGEELELAFQRALAAEVAPIPGVIRVLAALSTPICVASSGSHAKIRTSLGATGLLARFEGRIFSVFDVERAKPAPDVFVHAARELGADVRRCAVIEDSPAGVRAGVAAGMRVFGFCRHTPAERLLAAGADRVFADMAELPTLLAASERHAPARAKETP